MASDVDIVAGAATLNPASNELRVCYVKGDTVSENKMSVKEGKVVSDVAVIKYLSSNHEWGWCKWLGYSPAGDILGVFDDTCSLYKVDGKLTLLASNSFVKGRCRMLGRGYDDCRTQRGVMGEPHNYDFGNPTWHMDYVLDTNDSVHYSYLRLCSDRFTFLLPGGMFGLVGETPRLNAPGVPGDYRWVAENWGDSLSLQRQALSVPPPMYAVNFKTKDAALYFFGEHERFLLVTMSGSDMCLYTCTKGSRSWGRVSLPEGMLPLGGGYSTIYQFASLLQQDKLSIAWGGRQQIGLMFIDGKTVGCRVATVTDMLENVKDAAFVWGGVLGDCYCLLRRVVYGEEKVCLVVSSIAMKDIENMIHYRENGASVGVIP